MRPPSRFAPACWLASQQAFRRAFPAQAGNAFPPTPPKGLSPDISRPEDEMGLAKGRASSPGAASKAHPAARQSRFRGRCWIWALLVLPSAFRARLAALPRIAPHS